MKKQGFQPGMYEGKTPEQVAKETGTYWNGQTRQDWERQNLLSTPPSMRGLDMRTVRLRRDGKPCEPFNK